VDHRLNVFYRVWDITPSNDIQDPQLLWNSPRLIAGPDIRVIPKIKSITNNYFMNLEGHIYEFSIDYNETDKQVNFNVTMVTIKRFNVMHSLGGHRLLLIDDENLCYVYVPFWDYFSVEHRGVTVLDDGSSLYLLKDQDILKAVGSFCWFALLLKDGSVIVYITRDGNKSLHSYSWKFMITDIKLCHVNTLFVLDTEGCCHTLQISSTGESVNIDQWNLPWGNGITF